MSDWSELRHQMVLPLLQLQPGRMSQKELDLGALQHLVPDVRVLDPDRPEGLAGGKVSHGRPQVIVCRRPSIVSFAAKCI